MFGHFYAHMEGLAFGLAEPDRVRAKQMCSGSLSVPGKAAGGQVESCRGRASAQQNDSDLAASLTWAIALDKQTHCCFCYSLQGQGQPSQGAPATPLPASGCTGAASSLSHCSPRQPGSSCLLFGTGLGLSFLWQPYKTLSASAWRHVFA